MAPPADDPGRRTLSRLRRRLLEVTPGRLEFALRLALTCALTALVVEVYQTPSAAVTVYLVFFLNKPDRTSSLILSAALVVVITLVVAFLMIAAMVLLDAPGPRVACMAVVSLGMLFLASASKLRPIAGTVALLVGYALDLFGSVQSGEPIVRALLYTWLLFGIPAGVSTVVNLLLAPSPRRLVERAIAERLRVTANKLREPGDLRARSGFAALLRDGAGELLVWLKLAGLERTATKEDLAALRQATDSTTAIVLLADVITRDPGKVLSRAHGRRLAGTLEGMVAILEDGSYPVDICVEGTGEAVLSPLGARVGAEINAAIRGFAEGQPSKAPSSMAAKTQTGFFVPDAFTNPEHIEYAIKTTAAAMFCYVTYSLLDWPGIHTCMITCYIVSLTTAGETVEKLLLRIVGCLVGATVGIWAIVFLIPSLTSIGGLMIVVFVGALASGWIAAGGPEISYSGFQVALAFLLCVIQGQAPRFDLTVARDRVIGILFGIVVSYVLSTRLWPISVGRRIDLDLATILRRMSAILTEPGVAARCSMASEALAALGAVERDLALAEYEPATVRPSEDWIGLRRRASQELALLQGPIFASAHRPGESAALVGRLNRMADSLAPAEGVTEAAHGSEPGAPDGRTALDEIIGVHIRALEQALTHAGVGGASGDVRA